VPVAIPLAAAAVSAGATVYASNKASKANDKAAQAQTDANNQALALEREQMGYAREQAAQQRADLAPWREVGLGALQQLATVHGITLPQSVYQAALPSAQAVDPASIPDNPNYNPYADYVDRNPDLAALFASGTGQARGKSKEQFGAEHWQRYGQNETASNPNRVIYQTDPAVAKAREEAAVAQQAAAAAQAAQASAQPTAPQSPVAAQQDPQNRYGGFYASPDYQFRVDEGTRAITGNKAARGLLDSGALGAGLINYGQQAASQEFGNWYSRLANLAGVGQTAVNNSNQASQTAVNNNGQSIAAQGGLLQDNGATRASSIATNGGIQAGMISNLGNTAAGLVGNYSGGGGVMGSILRGQTAQPYTPISYQGGTPINPYVPANANVPGLIQTQPSLYGSVV
jgi:hypothetical protein